MKMHKLRKIKCNGKNIFTTPMILPSFSSKGFPQIGDIFDLLKEDIYRKFLISAYDVNYSFIKTKFNESDIIFLDSGGYEASDQYELADARYNTYSRKEWSIDKYFSVVSGVHGGSYVVFISYDNDKAGTSLSDQIICANKDFSKITYNLSIRDFLIKPSSGSIIDVNEIKKNIGELSEFDIIGLTEKELGASLHSRLLNLKEIRKCFDEAGSDVPIHIFGCQDYIGCILYYIAGADIFDGLNWLRYSFDRGAIYSINHYQYERLDPRVEDQDARVVSWVKNIEELEKLEAILRDITLKTKHSTIPYHSDMIEGYAKLIGVEPI